MSRRNEKERHRSVFFLHFFSLKTYRSRKKNISKYKLCYYYYFLCYNNKRRAKAERRARKVCVCMRDERLCFSYLNSSI